VFIINSYQLEKTKQPQVRLTDLFAYTFGLVYHRVPNALPVAKSTLVAFCSGVYQSAVFSSKQSMQTHYYRVEYGCCGKIKKTAYCCIRWKTPFGHMHE